MLQCAASPTLRLDNQVKALLASGQPVVNLTVGELDFATPAPIKQAVQTAIEQPLNRYTSPQGLPALRQAIHHYLKTEHNVDYSVDDIIVTNGAKQALYSITQVLLTPGAEVIVPIPAWVSYTEHIRLAGGLPVTVPCTNAWQLDVAAIAQAITSKTVAIIINYPNNPTGAIYDAASLQQLADLAKQHNLWVISDEIYEQIRYDATPFQSFATLYPEKTIVVNGVSKSGAMTGYRVGYAAGPAPVIEAMTRLQSHLCGNVSNLAQAAAIAALPLPANIWQEFMTELTARRQLVIDWVTSQTNLQIVNPAGAFYGFINIQQLSTTSEEFCERALNRYGVGLVPGVYFGSEGFVRLSFANSRDNISRALQQLINCVASYS